MADAFLELPAEDRHEALEVAASALGRPVNLLEKDVWVVWALGALFGSAFGSHLVFKGGTSLSKAYRVIRRFSEDVDLTYDIRALAPDLLDGVEDALPATRSAERRWTREIRRRLPEWVTDQALPVVAGRLTAENLPAEATVEGDRILIGYEPTATGTGYVRPSVMLEFGARSTGEPSAPIEIVCDAAEAIRAVDFPREGAGDAGGADLLGEGHRDPRLLRAASPAGRALLAPLARHRAARQCRPRRRGRGEP